MTRRRSSRTAVAGVLTALGVLIPCAAWYVAGSRAAADRAARLESEPAELARLEAGHLAEQIGLRLDALRESESRRPWHEYVPASMLPALGCSYEPTLGSPLAEGPADPLVWAHFQIDDVGVVTLPTLPASPQATARPADGGREAELERAILAELECASAQHLAALRREGADGVGPRRATLTSVVTVGAFSWHTLTLDDGPSLVALREVETPAAILTQGFVVPSSRLASLLAGAIHPAEIRPGASETPESAAVPLRGDAWHVRVDATRALLAARAEGAAARRRFALSFAAGALAAMTAGVLLVLLVSRSERAARERARFAASAAHELRTPLASLRLYGEMLADGTGDPARRSDYARRIAFEADRLGRVVGNVLGVARLERGTLAVRTGEGDLGAAVRGAVERLRPAVEAAGARLELAAPAEPLRARFDPDALEQILQNLVDNAEKFSRGAADRSIRVGLAPSPRGPVLSIEDRGPDVAPELRARLFRPFARSADPAAPEGLGIGLSLVRALAEAQGAGVGHAPPEPGRGARFFVRFAPPARIGPSPPDPHPRG